MLSSGNGTCFILILAQAVMVAADKIMSRLRTQNDKLSEILAVTA